MKLKEIKPKMIVNHVTNTKLSMLVLKISSESNRRSIRCCWMSINGESEGWFDPERLELYKLDEYKI